MNGRMMRGALALGLSAAVCACGSSEPELVNPVPGTELELVAEDGENHGPVMELTLSNAETLTVPVGDSINLVALGVFADGYTIDVTEHAFFQVSGGLSLGSRAARGVPAEGTSEGTAQVSLTLGTLPTPTINIAVTPAVLKKLTLNAGADEIPRGYGVQATLVGRYGDGSDRELTQQATWTSSNLTIATVSSEGIVTGVADGMVTITAEFEGETVSREMEVVCAYPFTNTTRIRPFQTFPDISWGTAIFPGTPQTTGSLSMKDLFCGENGMGGYRGFMIQLSAEWCGPCRIARQTFSANQQAFIDNGILPLFAELENTRGESTVTTSHANDSMSQELPDDFGIRVGDFDSMPQNVLNESYRGPGRFAAFPTLIVVRTSDMKVVATSRDQYGEFFQVYPQIFENLDWDWSDLTNPVP